MTKTVFLLVFLAQFAYGQKYDWHALFSRSRSTDQAVQDAIRDELLNKIIPKIEREDASLVVPEIHGLVIELNDEESFYRLQASGIFLVLSTFRPDSEKVLIDAFPALEKHAQDVEVRVSDNCVLALSGLMPSIPADVARSLADLLSVRTKLSHLATSRAIIGLQRIYGSDQTATYAIDHLVNGDTRKKLLFLNSFGNGIHPDTAIVTLLGQLLGDPDTSIVSATLNAIGNSGAPAIATLKPQLTDLEDQTKIPAVSRKAHELLRVLEPPTDEQ